MGDSMIIPQIVVDNNDEIDEKRQRNDSVDSNLSNVPPSSPPSDMRRRASEMFIEMMPVEQFRKMAISVTGWWSELQFFVGRLFY